MRTLNIILAACSLMQFSFSAEIPEEQRVKAKFPDFNSSAYIHGPRITAADLKGKVVLLEYWGINCGPCIASMPHLQELQNKFQDKDFTVIGSHRQAMSDKVKQFLVSSKITFPVYQMVVMPGADTSGGIPCAVLVGADGKIVAKGSPNQDMFNLVKKEIAKAQKGWSILGSVKLDKYKSLEKALVSNGVDLESKVNVLREKTGDEEAQAICEAYDDWVADTKEIIDARLKTDPLGTLPMILRLKAAVPSMQTYGETITTLKDNKDLPKLAELGKKVKALQQKQIKSGKALAEKDVQPLLTDVTKFTEADDMYTRAAAATLKQQLEDLKPSKS